MPGKWKGCLAMPRAIGTRKHHAMQVSRFSSPAFHRLMLRPFCYSWCSALHRLFNLVRPVSVGCTLHLHLSAPLLIPHKELFRANATSLYRCALEVGNSLFGKHPSGAAPARSVCLSIQDGAVQVVFSVSENGRKLHERRTREKRRN